MRNVQYKTSKVLEAFEVYVIVMLLLCGQSSIYGIGRASNKGTFITG